MDGHGPRPLTAPSPAPSPGPGAPPRLLPILRAVLGHRALHVGLVLLLFMAGRRSLWGSLTRVDHRVFDASSPLWASLHQPGIGVRWLIIAAVVALASSVRWRELDSGKALRVAVCFVAFIQMWLIAGEPYNLDTDRAYGIERLLAVALFGLTVWRPAFLPLLTALGLQLAEQSNALPRGLSWTERRLLLDFQIAFAAWLPLRRVLKAEAAALVFSLLVIFAGAYMYPCINKMQLGAHFFSWAIEDPLGNLFISSWAAGWTPLSQHLAEAIARTVNAVSPALGIGTLLIEAGACAALLHRRAALVAIPACILLHTGIYLASGIAFWKWAAVDAALLFLVWRAGKDLFTRWPWWLRAGGVVAVLLCQWTLQPMRLGWWDTKLSQFYDIEVVDAGGKVYEIEPEVFSPFDVPIVQGRLQYLVDEPTAVGALGAATSQRQWARIEHTSPTGALGVVRGSSALDEKAAANFDTVVSRTLRNFAAHHGRPTYWLTYPSHIHHGARGVPTWRGEPVVSARIRYRIVFFDGARLHTLVNRTDRVIDIASGRGRVEPRVDVTPHPHTPAEPGADLDFHDPCDVDETATLAILGDIALHTPLSRQVLAEGYEGLLGGLRAPLAQADASWVNLEGTAACCADGDGDEHPDPGRVFDSVVYTADNRSGLNFHPSLIPALRDVGVDVLGTVNNHSFDRGVVGIGRTLDNIDAAKLPHFGTRRGSQEPWGLVTSVGGLKVGWLGCTFWTNHSPDLKQPGHLLNCRTQREETLAALRELVARPDVDAVLFFVHGGGDRTVWPDDTTRGLVVDGADAGAAAVFTYHTHVMQSWEKHVTPDGREVPLVYAHGNFLTPTPQFEFRTSTIVYLTLGKRAGDAHARAVEITHRPLLLQVKSAEERHLLVLDDKDRSADARRALRLAWSRFGRSRSLHPGEAPRRACSDRPAPAAFFGGAGDTCHDDAWCAADLSCAPNGDVGICTKSCRRDQDCKASIDRGVCVHGACLRSCTAWTACDIGTHCERRLCLPD